VLRRLKVFRIFFISTSLCLTSCIYSTHHFNSGKLLKAGETQVTLGLGHQPLYNCANQVADSLNSGEQACRVPNTLGANELVEQRSLVKGSLNYRLGIRDNWWIFPGAELILHIEAPTNPATLEFGLKLALPGFSQKGFFHNATAGWGVGVWADNSFYGEYAVAKQWGPSLLFFNTRATYLATQINEVLSEEFENSLPSHQKWILQTGFGLHYTLPDIPIIPDVMIPNLNLTFPQVASGQKKFLSEDTEKVLWDFNFGFGWMF